MKELLETGVFPDLGYDETCDVLAGSIEGLNVVIKENNETKSYGCLMWVENESDPEDGELDSYLSAQVAEKPHIIKHYIANGRGAALALVKYNDAHRNARNIKEFITGIAADLGNRGYVNCCYACGNTEGLGIYDNGSAVAQYCMSCRAGRLIKTDDPAVEAALPVTAGADRVESYAYEQTENAADDDSDIEALLADASDSADELAYDTDRRIIGTDGEISDLNGLMVGSDDEEAEKPAEQKSELFETMQREYEEEQRRNAEAAGSADEALESLMYSAGEAEEKTEAPAAEIINAPTKEDETEITGLMYDGTEVSEEPEENEAQENDDNDANIYGLMLGSEQEVAEYGADNVEPLSASETGGDIEVVVHDIEKVGEDDSVAVTELYDDSNEGEDIDITALEPENDAAAVSAGEALKADETPLEQDGSVPLVNPNTSFGEETVSSGSGYSRGNVRAFAYGSYENANVAEEPVSFDGRPKGFSMGDPRHGDEIGSRSRDFSRQQFTELSPEKKKYKSTSHVVSAPAKASSRPVPSGRTVRDGSNAVLGTIAAVLFGLIGCAIWCGVGYITDLMTALDRDTGDIIVSICAFMPALFVFVGYRIGGDIFDKKGTIISIVITVILDAVGMYALLVTDVMRKAADLYGYDISLDKAFGGVSDMLSDSVAGKPAFMQIALSAVVMIIAIVCGILIARKRK